jgi:two-component system chemotaxis sensor kinase CheA
LLPLGFLSRVLRKRSGTSSGADELNIVVLQADGKLFGLVVDEVQDTQEIVVKPLGRELKGISVYSGATIMGDGRVALIIDVFGIADAMGIGPAEQEREPPAVADDAPIEAQEQSLLVFETLAGSRMAIPLDRVDRLEEVAAARLETVGERSVVQYKNQILSLVAADTLLGDSPPDQRPEQYQVVVVTERCTTFGLVVSRIADIVESSEPLQRDLIRPGVAGCAVVDGRVTEVLDLSMAAAKVRAMSGEAA